MGASLWRCWKAELKCVGTAAFGRRVQHVDSPACASPAACLPVQVEFWKRAKSNPELRQPHRLHVASAALGAACFAVEDMYPTLPLIHSVWHGLSAVAVHTTNALLRDADRRRALGKA